MPELVFVAADDTGRVRTSDLLTVRSHCMRGKNRKEGSRRSLRRAIQKAEITALSRQPESMRSADGEEWGSRERTVLYGAPLGVSDIVVDPALHEIPRGLLDEYYEIWATYGTYVRTLVQLLPVYRHVDFDDHDRAALEWMHDDSAFFHSIRLYTSAMNDIARRQSCPSRPTTLVHLRQTLTRLNTSLSDEDAQRRTSTAHTVVMLTIVSALFHDYVAAEAHLRGLEHIINLHGGRESQFWDPMLEMELDRLDIDYNLSTGNPPRFSRGLSSWDSIFQASNSMEEVVMHAEIIPIWPLPFSEDDEYLAFLKEAVPLRLVVAFQDLQQLTRLLHGVAGTETRISGQIARRAFGSLKTRLLSLDGTLGKGLAECLRLCMLVFLTTTFRLAGRKAYYWRFISGYRECFTEMHWMSPNHWLKSRPQYRDIILWLLVAGAMTAFDASNPCFCEIWDAYIPSAMTWEGLREILKQLAWADVVGEIPGKVAFDGMLRERRKREASQRRVINCQSTQSKSALVYRFVA